MSQNQIASELEAFIKQAIALQDSSALAAGIEQMIQKYPGDWSTKLFLCDAIPEPDHKGFADVMVLLTETLLWLKDHNADVAGEFVYRCAPVVLLSKCFEAITAKLESTDIFEKPTVRLIFRFAAFLEDQQALARQHLERQALKSETLYYESLLTHGLPAEEGLGKSSLVATYEEICENLELVLRYASYRGKNQGFHGSVTECKSPYQDQTFTELFHLAQAWRRYRHAWENVKYLGWYGLHPEGDTQGYLGFAPPDLEAFLRSEIAGYRKQHLDSQWSIEAQYDDRGQKRRSSDSPSITDAISRSIRIPASGEPWDGSINSFQFRHALRRTFFLQTTRLKLELYLYDQLIDRVPIGDKENRIKWETYVRINDTLRLLAHVISDATDRQLKIGEPGEEMRRIVVIPKNILARLIFTATDIELESCLRAISILTFNPRLKDLEIWDTPLIEVDSQSVLFVPSLVLNGNPIRAIENFVLQWDRDLFKELGKLLEQNILHFMRETKLMQAQGPIKVDVGCPTPVEFDLVAYWEEDLIFIEVKCTKSVYSAADYHRAQDRITEAVEQLNFRKKVVIENWELFKAAAHEMSLPDKCPPEERIHLIAVTNVMQFTGVKSAGVTVTDISVLKRFFGPQEIEVISHGKESTEVVGSLGRIRQSPTPHVSEFLGYLDNPPQVKLVRDCLSTVWLPILPISDNCPKIALIRAEYDASKKIKTIDLAVDLPNVTEEPKSVH